MASRNVSNTLQSLMEVYSCTMVYLEGITAYIIVLYRVSQKYCDSIFHIEAIT
jgi:hypothetical protein